MVYVVKGCEMRVEKEVFKDSGLLSACLLLLFLLRSGNNRWFSFDVVTGLRLWRCDFELGLGEEQNFHSRQVCLHNFLIDKAASTISYQS